MPHVLFPPARHPILWYWWFEWSVTRKLKQIQPQLFFSPEAYLSLGTKVPTIMTVHDLSLLHYPKHVSRSIRQYVHYFYPRFVKRADHIVTVSSYSRQDLIDHYPEAAAKVSVVFNGAREEYHPASESDCEATRQKYAGGKPYFLYVGALQPRKNIERLLQAFDRFKEQTQASHQLLLVGRKAWMTTAIEEAYQSLQHKEYVHFLDYQPLEVVATLMAAAHALTYVSLFEGFGIPILEALQSGIPVLTSNTTSMPEVAGDAGICVDPLSVEDISNGMIALAQDETFYASLKQKTLAQAAHFTWESSAAQMWLLMDTLASKK